MQHEWIKIDEAHPLPEGQEVIAYNKEWIYGYHNYSGTRIGFLNSQGEFVSARWLDTQESYETSLEDGDDYDTTRIVDGKRLHYYWRDGEWIEGHRPNMPTHYMPLPTPPDAR